MNRKYLKQRLYSGIGFCLLLLLFASCEREEPCVPAPVDEQFIITVAGIREDNNEMPTRGSSSTYVDAVDGIRANAFTKAIPVTATRGSVTTPMAENTRFRVVAYAAPRSLGSIAGQAEYTVGSTGVRSAAPLRLPVGTYEIMAYSYNTASAMPVLGSATLDVYPPQDFLTHESNGADVVIVDGGSTINLNLIFSRRVARVQIKLDATMLGNIINNPSVVMKGVPAYASYRLATGTFTASPWEGNQTFTFVGNSSLSLLSHPLYISPISDGALSLSMTGIQVEGHGNIDADIPLSVGSLSGGSSYQFTVNFGNRFRGSNCYIVTAPGVWQLDATVKGNGKVVELPVGYDAAANPATRVPSDGVMNIPASDISSAEVIWETTNEYDPPVRGSVVNNVSVDNGIVSFTTTALEGNALIAVRDAAGTILWSWHIWRTNDMPEAVSWPSLELTGTNHFSNGSQKIQSLMVMNRDLGAVRDGPIGMYYQWGRKDPFPVYFIDDYNAAKGMGVTLFSNVAPSLYYVVQCNSDIDNIGLAIHNPVYPLVDSRIPATLPMNYNTYVRWTARNDNLWGCPSGGNMIEENIAWLSMSNSNLQFSRLLSNKTIYDPCPAGWKVGSGLILGSSIAQTTDWSSSTIELVHPNGNRLRFSRVGGHAPSKNPSSILWQPDQWKISSAAISGAGTIHGTTFDPENGIVRLEAGNYPVLCVGVRCVAETAFPL